ncbi:hypothetical protein, partial [Escherichia coli]|uniref:hypothetical protein n=1 Tax=Escherichia coli TaxID=562 RepID=UPI0026720D1A
RRKRQSEDDHNRKQTHHFFLIVHYAGERHISPFTFSLHFSVRAPQILTGQLVQVTNPKKG